MPGTRSLALVAAAFAVAGAAPAAASDATLKAEVERVLPEVTPAVTAFRAAAQRAERTGDVRELRAATAGVREAITTYKWAVVNRKVSSRDGMGAKRQLLVAIRGYDIGFAAYANALDKATAGASKASTAASLRSFAKRIDEAVEDETAALEALGITG